MFVLNFVMWHVFFCLLSVWLSMLPILVAIPILFIETNLLKPHYFHCIIVDVSSFLSTPVKWPKGGWLGLQCSIISSPQLAFKLMWSWLHQLCNCFVIWQGEPIDFSWYNNVLLCLFNEETVQINLTLSSVDGSRCKLESFSHF